MLQKEGVCVTSHPLDDGMGVEYIMLLNDTYYKLSVGRECIVPAGGSAVASLSPYLYEITFEELKED